MAKNNIRDYDTSAAGNTDIGGIGVQGTNAVSNFDGAFREIMKQIADWNTGAQAVTDSARFCDPADATKQVRLDAGNVSAGQTRVLFMPDTNVTLSAFATTYLDDATAAATRATLEVPQYTAGTFTPTVSFATNGNFSPTYTTQVGEYFRIGDVVNFIVDIRFSANAYTTASGALIIGGLPLPVATASSSCPPSRIQNLTYGAGQLQFGFYPMVGTNNIQGFAFRSALSPQDIGTANIPASTANVIIVLAGFYKTS